LKTGLFEKVSKITSSKTPQPSNEQFKQYVVKESDSLWQIAAEYLGNGNRYDEIIQLNKFVITDADTLVVGMKLKLPAR
jgi:nucleoid-associated protein YgaU